MITGGCVKLASRLEALEIRPENKPVNFTPADCSEDGVVEDAGAKRRRRCVVI
jgi:hypothetical protein